ncbi:MAG: hypothetical protein LBR56_06575 [Sporomusaceae bacterium]|jgi:YbbR domain-containing protein|nr:hypothetical protein [Sporomusaceae bacterium]
MNKYFAYIRRFWETIRTKPPTGIGGEKTPSALPNRNLAAKGLALLVAAGLWLYVMNEQNPPIEERYTVPLEIRNVQPNYVVVDNLNTVRVRVRGPRALVAGVQAKDIRAYVDVTNLAEGSHSVNVHALIPSTLELVEAAPEMASVRLEPIITRTLSVAIDFNGTLPKGLIIEKVNTRTSEAVIKGPKHIVDTVDRLIGRIDISGKTASFSVEAPLIPVGPAGVIVEEITVSPQVTFVEIAIEPDVVKKNIEVKPVFAGDLPPDVTLAGISFDPPAIEVKENTGVSNLLPSLAYIYTEPIDLTGIDKDTTRAVKINLPAELTADPDTVKAVIKVEKN